MRLIGRFAVACALSVGLACSAMTGVLSIGPAAVAAVSLPGSATAFANPSTATAGTSITFQVTCASLEDRSATLFGTVLGLPERIPMDHESGGGVFSITVTLPSGIQPGTYRPAIDCSDGSSANARLVVTTMPAKGGAQTGDGTTSTETNNGLAVGGLAMIGAGAVLGGIEMRRRRGSVRRP
jgi:hypothetical protein